ncbi:uncharacterized protein LOC122397923 [Colletes gigas]|uniref:uncharacterized protein LOC122397923 n=1 Tax=Colletes gigas TaxID=935657 RepID=UPI001C9BB59F|nr:uncharacterized protein LOC122397923 [Colletes gigas]
MSKHRKELFYNIKDKAKENRKYKNHENLILSSDKEMDESVSDSQNFCLKLSQDSIVCDTQDGIVNDEEDIIVISDSSSTCSSPKCSPKLKLKLNRHYGTNKNVGSQNSTDSSNASEERFFQARGKNKGHNFVFHDWKKKNRKKNNTLFISDDSSSNSSEPSKRYIYSSNKASSNSISSASDKIKTMQKASTEIYSTAANEKNLLSGSAVGSSSSKNLGGLNRPDKVLSATNKQYDNFNRKLTPKNARDIMKNIKATKIVYESPRRQDNIVINKSIDNQMHPAISSKEIRNKIIDESIENSESDIIEGSQINSTNFYKNHVSRFLDTPCVSKHEEIIGMELSERKKKQISTWLMTNSTESISDNSFDIVPATNRDDVSSGNSSLERLEMNYETPNNRGKIHHVPTSKKLINQDRDKIIQPTVPRQTILHEVTQQSETDVPKVCTPKNNCTNNVFSTPTLCNPQNVDIMDCADILEKVYGKSWREKAALLLSKSEPRRQVISTRNRAVQTEKKIINKKKIYITDSDDDDYNTSLKDLQAGKCLTEKNTRKNTKEKNSFINDYTSSESGCESSYYTALTNPKITANVKPKSTVTPIVQRALAICDSDTDIENEKSNKIRDSRRKKLLFSDDESENSSTSEFDPGDDVPSKPTAKKDSNKTARQIFKKNTTIKSIYNRKYEKHNTFLASLSENVPIANAHPDAIKYRTDYKNNKQNLCNYLYKLYNENVFDKKLPEDMLIEWNVRMRGSAGFCYNKKSLKTLGGVVKSSRIVLATKVLDTPDRLRDTLIHEMCHAAAWLINNVSDGHGPFWTGWANKATKTFPELPPIRRCHDYKIKTKFTYKCIGCGYSIGRHSKSLDTEKKRCGLCYGKFELLINKTTKSGTVQVQTPKKELNGFARYVKDNYNIIKKERNIKHGEVMKILGQQFSAIKIATKQGNCTNEQDIPG